MPMTLKDQVAVAHALRILTGAKGWTKTADSFGRMECRLDAELAAEQAAEALAAETARIARAPAQSEKDWGDEGTEAGS